MSDNLHYRKQLVNIAIKIAGFSAKDLREITGCTLRNAYYIISGERHVPEKLIDSFEEIPKLLEMKYQDIVDSVMGGCKEILLYRSNDEYRSFFPDAPKLGKAKGGFNCINTAAAYRAYMNLRLLHPDVRVVLKKEEKK